MTQSIVLREDGHVDLRVVDCLRKLLAASFPRLKLFIIHEDADPSIGHAVAKGIGEFMTSIGPSETQEHLILDSRWIVTASSCLQVRHKDFFPLV